MCPSLFLPTCLPNLPPIGSFPHHPPLRLMYEMNCNPSYSLILRDFCFWVRSSGLDFLSRTDMSHDGIRHQPSARSGSLICRSGCRPASGAEPRERLAGHRMQLPTDYGQHLLVARLRFKWLSDWEMVSHPHRCKWLVTLPDCVRGLQKSIKRLCVKSRNLRALLSVPPARFRGLHSCVMGP